MADEDVGGGQLPLAVHRAAHPHREVIPGFGDPDSHQVDGLTTFYLLYGQRVAFQQPHRVSAPRVYDGVCHYLHGPRLSLTGSPRGQTWAVGVRVRRDREVGGFPSARTAGVDRFLVVLRTLYDTLPRGAIQTCVRSPAVTWTPP